MEGVTFAYKYVDMNKAIEIAEAWEPVAEEKFQGFCSRIQELNEEQRKASSKMFDLMMQGRGISEDEIAERRKFQEIGKQRSNACDEQLAFRDSQRVCQMIKNSAGRGSHREVVCCVNSATEEVYGMALFQRDYELITERGENLGKYLEIFLIATNPQYLHSQEIKGVGTGILTDLARQLVESDMNGFCGASTDSALSFYRRFGVEDIGGVRFEGQGYATAMVLTKEKTKELLAARIQRV